MPIPAELIDADAQKVIRRLVHHQHQAYLVGGCVRDVLLARKPKDFDIATSATPPEIRQIFRNCRIIGRRFRLAHIYFGSKIIETATFRANPRVDPGELLAFSDGESEEGDEERPPTGGDLLIRHDNVFGTAEEDARRRDFTINGLFYDLDADQVIDYVGGLADLAARTVRTIGDPDIRFREDPVRILRAIKFAARLDFHIEPVAHRAILAHRAEIAKCPAPRVLEEIYRLVRGGAARRSFELLGETGVLAVLMPELEARLAAAPSTKGPLAEVLTRLDARIAAGEMPSNAVIVCALLTPWLGRELFDDSDDMPRDIAQLLEEQTRPLFLRLRIARRDGERVRQILLAQRRLGPPRKRRGRAVSLVRRDWFDEATEVYRLLAPTLSPGTAIEEDGTRWQQPDGAAGAGAGAGAGEETPGASPDADAAGSDEPRRRRRRRGGRRRRGADGTTVESPE